MPPDVPPLRLVLAALVIGGLGASWWVAFDRGATWYRRAEALRVETDRLTAEVDGLRRDVARLSVVRVTSERCDDTVNGSGVIVAGRVLTNRHVVESASSVTVTLQDGTRLGVARRALSATLDLASLEVDGLGSRGVELDVSTNTVEAAVGSMVSVGGFVPGRTLVPRSAMVQRVETATLPTDPPRPLRLDVAVEPGESGSPVFSTDGRIAGLVYARARDDGSALVIPATDVRAALDRLVDAPVVGCSYR